jgi:Fumble
VHRGCLQIAYEVATSHGLQRVLFGGFFIRANGFTMETITFALDFWSKASHVSRPQLASLSVRSAGPSMLLLMPTTL